MELHGIHVVILVALVLVLQGVTYHVAYTHGYLRGQADPDRSNVPAGTREHRDEYALTRLTPEEVAVLNAVRTPPPPSGWPYHSSSCNCPEC